MFRSGARSCGGTTGVGAGRTGSGGLAGGGFDCVVGTKAGGGAKERFAGAANFVEQAGVTEGAEVSLRDKNDVVFRGEELSIAPENLPHDPLNTVACGGVADLLGHRDAQPTGRSLSRREHHDE